MATGINLAGRMPVLTQAVSNRLIMLGAAIGIVLLGAVFFGFRYRFQKQEARKESQQIQSAASDAATSNRELIEGGQSLPPSTFSGLPVAANQPPASTVPPPNPAATWPPANQPAMPSSGSSSVTQPYAPVPYRPAYFPVSPRIPVSGPEQTLNREQERRQQAMEAPTGAGNPGANSPSSASSALGAAQADLAQLNALVRQPQGSTPASTPVIPTGPVALAENEGAQGYRSQNDQSGKNQFANGGDGVGDDYLKTTRTPPLSPWVVQRGTVIPAALPNKLVSDLPGDLIAEVVRDVYDSPSQKYVEIPAGSRLVGEYSSSVSYGQNRVQIVWTAVYFPDGSFIDLDRMPSHSADGATGLKDQTDNHWKRVIAGVALSSVLSAGLQVSQNRTNGSVLTYPSTGQVIASSVGSQASQLGEQLTNHNLNIQPTLKIRPGEIFAVSVKKDIIFPGPYEPMERK
jgi:type IV secretory pathway VirB10-like protein